LRFSPPGFHPETSRTLFSWGIAGSQFVRNRSLSLVKPPFENLRIVHIRSEQVLLRESFDQGLVVDLTRREGQVLERLRVWRRYVDTACQRRHQVKSSDRARRSKCYE